MNQSKTIEELEKELEKMKASHRSMWDTYGSELCAGEMIRNEEKLEKKIQELKLKEEKIMVEDPKQIIDD